MKRAGAVIAIALAAGAASSPAPAQPPVKSTSLYCELQLQTKGQTMVQHPRPLASLKDGQQVTLGSDGIGSKFVVTFSDRDGYPAITIDKLDRRGIRTSSVEGSVEHSLTLNETDAKGNFSEVLCQLAGSDVAR